MMEKKFEGSSDRAFGLIFTAVLLFIALKPLLNHHEPRIWALVISGLFLAFALIAPALLHPLNRGWMKFGALMQEVMNPIIMGILFYLILTPYALVARLFGVDPMKRKFDPKARTYWIARTDSGPESDPAQSMRNQF